MKTSRPRVPGTGNSRLREGHSEPGAIPRVSAVASVKGLIDEPGWRWPCVAKLNGCWS